MINKEKERQIIKDTGNKYNEIIFEDDFIPKNVYLYQIQLRNKIINQAFINKKFSYVLDLGCGTGFHLKTLNQYADNLIGADMSFGALKKCKKNIHCNYIICDINNLPFKSNSLDCIWIAGVLHHVPDELENVISNNVAKILKKGGICLIDEPNKLNLLNYIIMQISKADPTGKERPLSPKYIIRLLKKRDFEILNFEFYELFSPVAILLKSEILFRIFDKVDMFFSRNSLLKLILFRWTILAEKC